MDCRGRSAQGGHGVANLVLRQRDHVHVALDNDGAARLAYALSRLRQTIKLTPFFEQRRFRRVEVFGLAGVQDAATKTDHHAALVHDRKHDAIAKTIVTTTLVVLDHQSDILETLVVVFRKRRLQALPAIGRVAKTVLRRDLARQSAALQVIDGAAGILELVAVKLHRLLHDGVQVGALRQGLGTAARLVFGHFHAGVLSQVCHRLNITKPGVLHQKSDGVTVGAAAKTMIKLLGRTDRERG